VPTVRVRGARQRLSGGEPFDRLPLALRAGVVDHVAADQGVLDRGAAHAARGAPQEVAVEHDGDPVVHLRHVWDGPEATFMRPGTPGVEIHPALTPVDSEPVLDKTEPNGFLGTGLAEVLEELDVQDLHVVGMMSSMCVDATVRAAADLGLKVTVVHDGCAAPDLEFDGVAVPGAMVHAAFMAALADGYADVVSSIDLSAR
jgi:nicotinamidase-related amidase